MLACVVATGHVIEGRRGMAGSRSCKSGAGRVVAGEGAGDTHHAPRAAEVEPVQMNELRVGSIRDDRGCEESVRLTSGSRGQEFLEPGAEFSRRAGRGASGRPRSDWARRNLLRSAPSPLG